MQRRFSRERFGTIEDRSCPGLLSPWSAFSASLDSPSTPRECSSLIVNCNQPPTQLPLQEHSRCRTATIPESPNPSVQVLATPTILPPTNPPQRLSRRYA